MDPLKIFRFLSKVLFLLSLLLTGGCGENMDYLLQDPVPVGREITVRQMEGIFASTDGEDISLGEMSDRPIVLMFASSLCGACLEEVEEIKKSFSPPERAPSHFQLYTLLIYETREDAQIWKAEQGINWIVGADPQGQLFKKYCEKDQTPCTIVHHPQRGIILNQHGKVKISTLMELVGPW